MIDQFSAETAQQRLVRYEAIYYGIDAFALVAKAHGTASKMPSDQLAVDNALQALLAAQIRFAKAQIEAAAEKASLAATSEDSQS